MNVVYKILDKIINDINVRLKDKGIVISLTNKASEYVINNAYDENFGARPIKRYVSENLETLLAMKLIDGTIKDNSKVVVDVRDNGEFYIEGSE